MDLQVFRMGLDAGDQFEYHLLPQHEYLPGDFQISRGIVLPAGASYDFLRRRLLILSAPQRVVAVRLIAACRRSIAGAQSRLCERFSSERRTYCLSTLM
jgi:hypothetical protein